MNDLMLRLVPALLLAGCVAPQNESAEAPQNDNAASSQEDAPALPRADAPVTYRAVGQEPGWLATIADGQMTLLLDYGERRFVIDDPEVRTSFNGHRYTGMTAAGAVALDATHQLCKDSMSGMNYPDMVRLTVGDDSYRGCGGDPAELLGGDWRVVEIGGEAVAGNAGATLRFERDRVSGRAVCNSFEGGYSVGGEGMTVGTLIQTEIACAPPQMAQEAAFLGILDEAARFDIGADGRLTIEANDGRRLVAVRD